MSIKNTLIGEQFRLIQKIGQGSFGKVYLAHDGQDNHNPVSIKTESLHQTFSQLLREIQNFKALESLGFPRLIKQGISVDNEVIYMVTELLGPSLEDLFNLCGCKFSLKTTLMLFYQLLERMQYMHEKNYIHRDIKPDNILMGLGDKSNVVHMIDFGLTRLVIDPKTGKHIPFVSGKNLIGTCRYVSVNSHMGFELSRRDDLITLGYVIINLFKGGLPWQGINTQKPSARYRKIGKVKQEYSNWRLCKDCPSQFMTYMDYVTNLDFEEAADFNMLKTLVLEAASDANLNIFDNVFDWSLLLTKQKISSEPKRERNQNPQRNQNHFNSLENSNDSLEARIGIQSKIKRKQLADDEERQEKARNFRFHTFNDVKVVIYQAYSKRRSEKKKSSSNEKNEKNLAQKSKVKKHSNQRLPRDLSPAQPNHHNKQREVLPVEKQKEELKNYVKLQIKSPEWHGIEPREFRVPEESKKQAKGKRPVIHKFACEKRDFLIDESEPSQFHFYNVDKRKPKQLKQEVYKDVNPFANLEDSQGSLDSQGKLAIRRRRQLRPASNQIDRFGRIAFNKQKELSQASFELGKSDRNPEEEKKCENALLSHRPNPKHINSDGQGRQFNRFNQRQKKFKSSGEIKDPMELELCPANLINRLDNMKQVLGQGQLIDQQKLQDKMGDAFEVSKQKHQMLQAKQRIELEKAQIEFKQRVSERGAIAQRVNHDQLVNEQSAARNINIRQAFSSVSNHRQFATKNIKQPVPQVIQFLSKAGVPHQNKQARAQAAANHGSENDLELLSDCSAEVPSEHVESDEEEKVPHASNYMPVNYIENYKGASILQQQSSRKKS